MQRDRIQPHSIILLAEPAESGRILDRVASAAQSLNSHVLNVARTAEALATLHNPHSATAEADAQWFVLMLGSSVTDPATIINQARVIRPELPVILLPGDEQASPDPAFHAMRSHCIVPPSTSADDLYNALIHATAITPPDGLSDGPGAGPVAGNDAHHDLTSQDHQDNAYNDLALILNGIADGITAQDPHGRFLYVNDAAARITGFASAGELLRTPVADVMARFEVLDENGAPLPLSERPTRRALQGEHVPETLIRFRIVATGEEHWSLVKATPAFGDQGNVRFAINIFRDITRQKVAEDRMRLLAQASDALAAVLDYEATVHAVAQLAVPRVGDWCMVSMVTAEGGIHHMAIAHSDPERVELAHEMLRRFPTDPKGTYGVAKVIQSGESLLVPEISDAMLSANTRDPEQLELWRRIGFSSLMIVPLIVRGKAIGTITLVMSESGRKFDATDLSLAEELAQRAAVAVDNARLHRTAQEQREWLQVTLSSIGDAVIATDTSGRITFMNQVAEGLTGWKQQEAFGKDLTSVFRIVNEDSRRTVESPVEKVIETGTIVGLANHTILIGRDGSEIPIDDSAAPIKDASGKMIGVVLVFHDVTERRRAERERQELLEREQHARLFAEQSEERYRVLADAMPQIVWTTRADGTVDYYNQRWYNYTGLTPDNSSTTTESGVIHPDDLLHIQENWRRSMASGTEFEHEFRLRRHDGIYRWHLGRTVPWRDRNGDILLWIGTSTDIDDQKRAEEGMKFLAGASKVLSSSLDYATTLSVVSDLAVPDIADWCSVDVLNEDGTLRNLHVSHIDPEKVKWAHELQQRFPPDMDAPAGLPNVIRTGKSEFYPEITDEMLVAAAKDEEQLRIGRQVGYTSVMIVPLVVQERTIGAITFVTAESGRRYVQSDLELAEELARRVGTAIDNAWLYRKAQEEIAVRAQRESELRISETRFRTMIEQSPLSIQIYAPDGALLQANHAWEELWQLDRSKLAGYNIFRDSMVDAMGLKPYVVRGFAGETVSIPPMLYAPSSFGRAGRSRWVRAFIYPVTAEGGVITEVVLVLEDVTEHRNAEQALLESEERFRTMADGAPVLIWMTDTDAGCSYVNLPWLEFTGSTLEKEHGAGWMQHIHPEDAPRFMEMLASATREPFRFEMRMRHNEGEYRWLLNAGIPRFASDGSFAGFIGSCIDITDRRQAVMELQRAKETAEAASQAKDQFLAVLSHELRTPLTPVLTLTQVLKQEEMSEEMRSFVDIIHRNIELEARLIDDLLDLTRIEKGKLQLNREVVDAHLLIDNVLEICREDIAAKGLRLALELEATAHHVRADSARLQQIFWNLVKNAVKFTDEGGTITVRSANHPSGMLRVEVADTGIGIDPHLLPHIFDAFEQGGGNITRQFGGLGLGLAISKALAGMHGGRLTAASEGKGEGATFTLSLATVQPLAQAESSGADEGTPETAEHSISILLVDDHEDTNRVMKVLLERHGYKVTAATTMQAGLEAAISGSFDLLISDIGLPDGSGLDLMQQIGARGIALKGIALSGFGMEEDVRRSRDAGFAEHLTKPVSFRTLHEMIERLAGS